MDSKQLREMGKRMVDFVADYWDSLPNREPLPCLTPGFIKSFVPEAPPTEIENWEDIFKDIEPVVLAGNTHWQHPNFFAYFPTACSYHSILGDILSSGLASVGFSWSSSPSMTELELRMTDWLAKILHLPDAFLNDNDLPGGGIIQNTASDSTFIAMLSARARAVEVNKSKNNIEGKDSDKSVYTQIVEDQFGTINHPGFHDPQLFPRLIAYCSDQAHSSVEKAAMLNGVKLRKLRSQRGGQYDNFHVAAETLDAAIKEDRRNNLIPFIFILTVGTTSTCGIDSIDELAPICCREGIWVHVDSAYAGSFMICPEYRDLCKGLEFVDSFNTNVHKSLMINFDCSPMWFKNAAEAVKYFKVDPPYLKHEHQKAAMDYRHLQIALGRRFRSLKVWFVLRNIGVQQLQNYQQKKTAVTLFINKLIATDPLFELFVPRQLALVCFRLKSSNNEINEHLYQQINSDRQIHLTSSNVNGIYFLRFAVCSPKTTEENVKYAYSIIRAIALKISKPLSASG
ncbi:unnamed protein product [Enterobius vermicularis]|uniref:Aromatic-L-amino-acid decarboxylase n=1 Tax=Enterobius vermicularis TaxID=51028 RepID=A0A0N4VHP0_ENTVE|nr:unnamed protein product [Enterobius vermicularis]